MKNDEFYNIWKEQKRQIETGRNFPEKVMNQICQYEQKKRRPLFDIQQLIELMSAHPLAKAGLVAAGAVTGFVRLVFVVYTFLGT